MFRRFAGYAAAFAGTLAVLWLALFLSALIPNDAIAANMERSAERYATCEPFEFTEDAQLNSVADHYADSIWLNVAWNMGVGDALTASIRTDYYDGEDLGENAGLYFTVTEGTPPNVDYTRYWHGTAGVIRLMHLVTDVEGTKLAGFALFLLLTAVSALMLLRRRQAALAALLLLSLAAVRIWNIRLSLEYQPAFLVAFALIPFYLHYERRGDRPLILLSIIGGASVAFFDFLTTETVTVLLPLVLVVALRASENRLGGLRESLSLAVPCGLGWGLAYAGAFLVKWTLASLVTGANAFAAALSSVGERVGSSVPNDFGEQPASFLSAPLANLTMLFGGPRRVDGGRLLIGLGAAALLLFSLWYLLRGKTRQSTAALTLLGLGALVLLRCLVLNNHSYLHCFFTYRALASTVLAVLAAVCLQLSPREAQPQKKRRRK